MDRETHKELFNKLEEMFWAKETSLILLMGNDPDGKTVAVIGPDADMKDVADNCMNFANGVVQIRADKQDKQREE